MARNAAGEGELLEQALHSLLVLLDVWVHFAVGPLQVGVRHQPRSAVAGSGDVEDVLIVFPNDAVQMGVDEVQSWCRAPVTEQARFDVSQLEGLLQQRTVVEI